MLPATLGGAEDELPSTSTGNIRRNKLDRFRTCLRDENIRFIEDIVANRSYKQHAVTDANFLKNILIRREGEHESLGNIIAILKAPATRVARVYLENDKERERAAELFAKC
jgi:uncharacterized protein